MTSTTKRPEKLVIGEKYVVMEKYHREALPLVYHAEKHDILEFQGRAVTSLQFQRTTQPYGVILMDKKTAFRILRPIPSGDSKQ